MIDQLKPLLGKLALFSQERLGFKHPPKLFLRNDSQNSQKALGKTAFYNPQEQSVTLFIHGRHPKDILRSFTHELVHHCQNERGDLSPDKMTSQGPGYAQECPHMRKMEQEAYLEGNMCFRDWEDAIEDKDLILIKLAESKFLKENKTMTTKITKEFLRETIRKILQERKEQSLEEMNCTAKRKDNCPHPDTCPKHSVKEEMELEEEVEELQEAKCCGMKGCPGPGKPHSGKFAIQENEELEEGKGEKCTKCKGKGCDHCDGKGYHKLEENEELEEGDIGKRSVEAGADNNPEETKMDHLPAAALKKAAEKNKKQKQEESKIQTPEQENTLYESRFTPRNTRLFEKLVKQWTK